MILEALPDTRPRFFLLRLALTALMLLFLAGVVRYWWYPGMLLQLSGSLRLILVVTAVSLVIGPGLSTLLYRPGKRGLLLDLVVVLVIELVVIAFVAGDLYKKRPFFAVFAVDRFELVAEKEVDWRDIRYEVLRTRPHNGPRLVFAKLPDDPAMLSALIEDTVIHGGADIDRRPEFWQPYPDGIAVIRNTQLPLERVFSAGGDAASTVRAWLANNDLRAEDYGYLPVRGRAGDAAMVVERASALPVTILDFDPW